MVLTTLSPDIAPTISDLFRARVEHSPDKIAYREYDVASRSWHHSSWRQMAVEVARWQAALRSEGLQAGDRVAIMLKNCRSWVVFDQAALGLGLVTVPLYADDRPDNVSYILEQTQSKLILLHNKRHWQPLLDDPQPLPGLIRIISLDPVTEEQRPDDCRLLSLSDWLFGQQGELADYEVKPDDLASIVYTSGTTGRPKGVMLSHHNILSNAWTGLQCAPIKYDDLFLSFLPLSHMLERTVGYIIPMMLGAEVAYNRAIPQLAHDMHSLRPTVLVSVPRIYERIYSRIHDDLTKKSWLERTLFKLTVKIGDRHFEYQQGRHHWSASLLLWPLLNQLVASKIMAKLGGRLRVAICGGAALSPEVNRLFLALGTPLLQGYGLTESSPVISVNRLDDNIPASIGLPLPEMEVRIGKDDELQTRSDSSMLGYWQNEQATHDSFTEDGWLRTGDKARIDEQGHLYITGRLKEIIVMANGEKVPPTNMENAIILDSLFDQVLVIGEGKPHLSALLVLNSEHWQRFAEQHGYSANEASTLHNRHLLKAVSNRVNTRLHDFPGYAQIHKVALYLEPWSVENGLATPTLKIKRAKVMAHFAADIEQLYINKRHRL